ncbi:MAG: hypothetical protein V1808_03600 [Candidatus Daviesbacteria bacterium]
MASCKAETNSLIIDWPELHQKLINEQIEGLEKIEEQFYGSKGGYEKSLKGTLIGNSAENLR